MTLRVCALVLAVAALAAAHNVVPCFDWPLLMQCNPSWGSIRLGTSTSETICTAGCALTSTTMALRHANATISGKPVDPAVINEYLVAHGGYEDTDLIVWSAVNPISSLKFASSADSMALSTLISHIKACHPVVIQVNQGTHFVLAIGYDSADQSTIVVNDPYFNTDTYAFSGISQFVVFTD
eukprot:Amastigsp_a676378_152.p2 type:complete len:182 gc:universal Amastigsp_a676378_152:1172-627(-)